VIRSALPDCPNGNTRSLDTGDMAVISSTVPVAGAAFRCVGQFAVSDILLLGGNLMSRFIALSAVAVSLMIGNTASAGCWPFHSHCCCENCVIVPKVHPSRDQFVNGELLEGIPCFPYPCGWYREPFGTVAPSFPPAGMYPTVIPAGMPAPIAPSAMPAPVNAPSEAVPAVPPNLPQAAK
jgi:hypothetical protein